VMLRTIRTLGLALIACLGALPAMAVQNAGKISGVVLDAAGAPQMGATVVISSEKLFASAPLELLTNDSGRFASASTLVPGLYSIRVTLAGFMPSVEQHVQVTDQRTTVLQIVLGSVLSSLDKVRRQPDQQLPGDEWGWVLRSDAATRPVLRWQDGEVLVERVNADAAPRVNHARLEFTSGSEHPGSVSNLADSPATAFAYEMGIGPKSKLLMAGQFSYEGTSPSGGLAAEWVPSGELGSGPVTSLVIRESRLGPDLPTFRGVRLAHDDQFALGDRITVRYGAEALAAGFSRTALALRPRLEVAYKLSPSWQALLMVAARPWDDSSAQNELQSTLNSLDAFPTLLLRDGRPVLASDLHEEIGLEHELSDKSDISVSVFHDRSSHTAVFGRGSVSGSDFLQDFFSDVFAYDGGASASTGTRLVYRRKLSDNMDASLVYAYAGALSPDGEVGDLALRDELVTKYRQSFAGRISAKVPRTGTKFTTSYKWIGGSVVSPLDAFGESIYHIDPYLSMEVRQPLPSFIPGHVVALADVGNLLAQGYVPIATSDGRVVLVPTYRFFRGGLSIQF
jgi:Carboxypeptidase regulatory-like domain